MASRISGDYAALYNCRFLGFQDTLLDEHGRHFYKDCYIEGTVDFIFGNAKSIYLVRARLLSSNFNIVTEFFSLYVTMLAYHIGK